MPDHTWRHRHVNVENKKRAQEGKEPFPKYKGKGWDQKSQNDGSWQPSDVDYEQMEKDLGKEGQLTWPKPKIHPDDVAPEDKYKNELTIGGVLTDAWQGAKTLDYEGNNPLDKLSDVGAWAASNTIEALIPQNREELMFELMTLGQGKKIKVGRKLAHAALKDIPLYQKGTKYVSDLIEGVWKQSRFAQQQVNLDGTLMMSKGADDIPLSQRMGDAYARNKKVIKEGKSLETGTQLDFTDVTPANEKTLKKMGLWDYKSVFSMDDLDGIITRSQAKGIVTPDIPGFTKAQAERLGKIDELKSFYKNLTTDQIIPELDHKTPLKLSAFLMDKTTGAKRVAIRKVILDEGIYLAEMKENMQALPREVHKIWTDNMNKYLGKTHKNFQDTFLAEMKTLGITDPLDIAREFARRIKAARETFDVAFDAHKITYGSEWTNNIDDMVNKLDEAFEAGDEWAPRRTNEAVSGINESLSNLDEVPFNNKAAEDLIRRFNLDDLDVNTLSELSKKPMSEQVRFIRQKTGSSIGEINDALSAHNISIADLLDLLDE